MRSLRFHEFGDPSDVLRLDDVDIPQPGPGQVRVAVQTCGLNPADWALCGGLFAGELPRGIGLEIAGTVDAVGADVAASVVGQAVFGPAPYTGPSAGASQYAVVDEWFPRPDGLDPVRAAALPMAVETAYRGLTELGVRAGTTVLVHGAGSTVGFAATQIARRLGARVIATAGRTHTDALRATGAELTTYGDGMAQRVRALAGGPVDLALDAAPVSNALPQLVDAVRAPADVLTLSDFAAAGQLGVRVSFGTDASMRNDVLGDYAQLAAEGAFAVPVARVFGFDDWVAAVRLSRSGRAGGKPVLQIGADSCS